MFLSIHLLLYHLFTHCIYNRACLLHFFSVFSRIRHSRPLFTTKQHCSFNSGFIQTVQHSVGRNLHCQQLLQFPEISSTFSCSAFYIFRGANSFANYIAPAHRSCEAYVLFDYHWFHYSSCATILYIRYSMWSLHLSFFLHIEYGYFPEDTRVLFPFILTRTFAKFT